MEPLCKSYRLWEPPVSHKLDELTGQIVDIRSAHSFLRRLNALAHEPTKDGELIEAYSISALVRYCRCFTSGSRPKLQIEDLKAATPEEVDVHHHIRGARDWHIAHPVNLQEVHAVHLIVATSEEGTPVVLGASSFSSAALALDSKQIGLALSLTGKWILLLQNRLAAEQLRLMPYAQALSSQQLLALPEKDPEPNRDVRARRKQGRAQ
jgi:hypothetical protein